MRVHGSTFTINEVVQGFSGRAKDERALLEHKLRQVNRWQTRLNLLKDPELLTKVKTLLTTFDELRTKEGIVFIPPPKSYAYHPYAKYEKGDVSLTMYVDLNVTPEKLWANFYNEKNNTLAYRIFIGKNVRIKNSILSSLLDS